MTATLFSGAESLTVDGVVGLTIAQAREQYAGAITIPSGSTATLNGRRVTDNTVIQADDEVSFNRPLGEKGR